MSERLEEIRQNQETRNALIAARMPIEPRSAVLDIDYLLSLINSYPADAARKAAAQAAQDLYGLGWLRARPQKAAERILASISRHFPTAAQPAAPVDCEYCAKGIPKAGEYLHNLTPDLADDETHYYKKCAAPVEDAPACSNKFCTDGWVDKAYSSPDGTENWVDQVPCQVCRIHCDPAEAAPAPVPEATEVAELREALRELVCSCTPTGVPGGRNYGVRTPEKEVVERARKLTGVVNKN